MVVFAICDDDKIFAKDFAHSLKQKYNLDEKNKYKIQCVYYPTGEELINDFLKEKIDVVFMDIEIGKENGFEVAKQLVKIVDDLGIVYVTNHDYYATEAFVCRPLGFIRKTKVENDIDRTLFSVNEFLSKRRKEFVFQDGLKPIPILLDKVRMVEVYDHDFVIVLEESMLQIKDKLKRIESELEANDFVKLNRNRMVNLKYVKLVEKNECVMFGGDRFRISEDRIIHVKDSVIRYKINH